jgi:di/tricarboxylate transporter
MPSERSPPVDRRVSPRSATGLRAIHIPRGNPESRLRLRGQRFSACTLPFDCAGGTAPLLPDSCSSMTLFELPSAAAELYTFIVLVLLFVALAREWTSPDVTVFSALCALWVTGLVTPAQALAGFSNPQVLAVALLFIVSAALHESGALAPLTRVLLRDPAQGKRLPLARMLLPVGALSAFLNNTPLVALFTPALRDWALRHDRAPSRVLIPLSYVTILGGTCTLIGTSTNLVVSGLLQAEGYEPFQMFSLTGVALPVAAAGLLLVFATSDRLLPDRRSPDQDFKRTREFGVRLGVQPDCPLVGRTVQQGGLRSLSGLYLAEIERGTTRIVPVRPTTRIEAGDRLVLYGVVDTVVELRRTPGLVPVDPMADELGEEVRPGTRRHLFEVVLSTSSPLVGSTLKDAGFRRRYDAAVVAVHRNGERMRSKLGEIPLRAGDTLLLEAAPGFAASWGGSTDFYLVSALDHLPPATGARSSPALWIGGAMITAMAVFGVSPALAAGCAVVALVWGRAIRPSQARKAVDLNVLVVIAASFGISRAVIESGLADRIASALLDPLGTAWPVAMIAALWVLTVLLTEILSNNAAAALMLPIALRLGAQFAERTGTELDPWPWAATVALAASMSFITPIGYQTNLMVYGPGGYRFSDFARLGLPVALLCAVVGVCSIAWRWGLFVA